jgi:hypothetical protein
VITFSFNKPMMSSFESMELVHSLVLPESMRHRLDILSFVRHDDCYFADYLYKKKGNATRSLYPDETGYECYVNHFHIDDCDPNSVTIVWVKFCLLMDERWRQSEYANLPLRQIVSYDGPSCVYRWHVARPAQCWLASDLDSYEEAIMVVDT